MFKVPSTGDVTAMAITAEAIVDASFAAAAATELGPYKPRD